MCVQICICVLCVHIFMPDVTTHLTPFHTRSLAFPVSHRSLVCAFGLDGVRDEGYDAAFLAMPKSTIAIVFGANAHKR